MLNPEWVKTLAKLKGALSNFVNSPTPPSKASFDEECSHFNTFVNEYKGALRQDPDAVALIDSWNSFVSEVKSENTTTERVTAATESILDRLDATIGSSSSWKPAPTQGHTIQVTQGDASIAVLSLAPLYGSIQVSANTLSNQGDQERQVAEALKTLADSISTSELGDLEKKDALEVVDNLTSQAKESPDKRSAGILKALFTSFPGMISNAKAVADLWEKYAPLIQKHLGI